MEADPGQFFVQHEARSDQFFGEIEGANTVLLELLEVNAVFKQQIDRIFIVLLCFNVVVEVKLPCRYRLGHSPVCVR